MKIHKQNLFRLPESKLLTYFCNSMFGLANNENVGWLTNCCWSITELITKKTPVGSSHAEWVDFEPMQDLTIP